MQPLADETLAPDPAASGESGLPSGEGVALCQACGLTAPRFNIGGMQRCLACALRYGPLLRRSLLTALFVGTVLTAINQGNLILSGNLPASLIWKVPLTYCVPFFVATWGALINSRLPGQQGR
jgi:hypothetical protein